jgi:NADH-ubiquinone oxidoreductase chain 5
VVWGVIYFLEWEILEMVGVSWVYLIILDPVSLAFMGLVFFISSMVIFYRTFYVSSDSSFVRFIILVSLFVGSIILIIISPNIISILLGWDGLGLVSYCLIIFYENRKSSRAGILTILSNRVGDIFILLSVGLSVEMGRINFFFFQGFVGCRNNYNLIFFFLVVAAITKRAQIPFSA